MDNRSFVATIGYAKGLLRIKKNLFKSSSQRVIGELTGGVTQTCHCEEESVIDGRRRSNLKKEIASLLSVVRNDTVPPINSPITPKAARARFFLTY